MIMWIAKILKCNYNQYLDKNVFVFLSPLIFITILCAKMSSETWALRESFEQKLLSTN